MSRTRTLLTAGAVLAAVAAAALAVVRLWPAPSPSHVVLEAPPPSGVSLPPTVRLAHLRDFLHGAGLDLDAAPCPGRDDAFYLFPPGTDPDPAGPPEAWRGLMVVEVGRPGEETGRGATGRQEVGGRRRR